MRTGAYCQPFAFSLFALFPCVRLSAAVLQGEEVPVRIVDLDETTKPVFCQCLEDWSDDVKETGGRRCQWVDKFTPRGLRAKLALDDAGTVGGMIQYLPIEQSTADGTGLYFIPCIWVHGHKTGRGNFQGRGMGKALLAAAEEDARALGAKARALGFLSVASGPFVRSSYNAAEVYAALGSASGAGSP